MECSKLQVKNKAASSRKLTVHGSDISTSAGIGGDLCLSVLFGNSKYIIILLYLAHCNFHLPSETGLEVMDSLSPLPK